MRNRYLGLKLALALAAGLSPLMSTAALASNAGAGTINTVIVNSQGKAFFTQTGSRSGQPSCATTEPNRWAFDVTTAKGQAMLALVLTAYSAGKQVTVNGIGSCPDWGDTETVDYIVTVN